MPVANAFGTCGREGPAAPQLFQSGVDPVDKEMANQPAKSVDLVVAPAIRFGAMSRALSGGGETFPGTLSLRAPSYV